MILDNTDSHDRRPAWPYIPGVCLLLLIGTPADAQTSDGSRSAAPREGIIIGGSQATPQSFERCVEVEIGGDQSMGCLNQRLRRDVERVNPTINVPPLDARSPDVRVGNVNEAAVRQQYGSNYGRSVVPYRPPAPVFVMPRR